MENDGPVVGPDVPTANFMIINLNIAIKAGNDTRQETDARFLVSKRQWQVVEL